MEKLALNIYFVVLLSFSPGCYFNIPCPHHGTHTWSEGSQTADIYQAEYKGGVKTISPGGVEYVGDMDSAFIDRMVYDVQKCVSETPPPYSDSAWCYNRDICPNTNECINILITEDWQWSCDKSEQLLMSPAPLEGCIEKGFEKDSGCPCRFRGGSQRIGDKILIVSTPNFRMLRYELARYQSGCWNAWYDKRLTNCFANIDDEYWQESIIGND